MSFSSCRFNKFYLSLLSSASNIRAYSLSMASSSPPTSAMSPNNPAKRVKLTGRAFYESIGSPKMIVAPMVDRSEYAWRLLTRSYLSPSRNTQTLAYSPMLHARLFSEQANFRDAHFNPTKDSLVSVEKSDKPAFLDGHPEKDRPLFVQFCANKPNELLEAARYVAPYCDAVDLNLGCPQGIARAGHYGAFLQEDWDTIHAMIRKLRDELSIPVTAKMRVLDTKEKTLDYARMILDAGASILTVHGRRREQKGHNMGVADWAMIRYLRENLPKETVLFANGNILNAGDIESCLETTGVDGIMSAEGNLSDPTIFAERRLRTNEEATVDGEYWWSKTEEGVGGYRIDSVFRRYMDIIWRDVLEKEPPRRNPLYIPGHATTDEAPVDTTDPISSTVFCEEITATSTPDTSNKRPNDGDEPAAKRHKSRAEQKKEKMEAVHNPSLKALQGHLFQLLRPMLSRHTHIRDALARARAGNLVAFERVLDLTEAAVHEGLQAEHELWQRVQSGDVDAAELEDVYDSRAISEKAKLVLDESESSKATRKKYGRPWWVCQPYIRPMPEEALKIGSIQVSKKDMKKQEKTVEQSGQAGVADDGEGRTNVEVVRRELPQQEALACG